MGSVDFNEFLDNLKRPEDEPVAYMQFLKDSLDGKRPGLTAVQIGTRPA